MLQKKRRYFWTTLHWAQFIISDAFSKEYIWKLFISISKSTCCKVSSWSDCWNTHAFGGLKPWWHIRTKTKKANGHMWHSADRWKIYFDNLLAISNLL